MKISFVAAAICAVLALGSTAAHAQTYAYVIDVAKSGAPFNDPVLALASITDASADHPYLVKIHPGVYDVGATAVTGKPYVDIEGSGEGVTILRGTSNANWAVLRVAANETVRDLTVRGYTEVAGQCTLRNVTVDAPNSSWAIGLNTGAVLDHVSVISSYSSEIAIWASNTTVVLDHCSLLMGDTSLDVTGSGNTITLNETNTYARTYGIALGYGASNNTVRINRSYVRSSRFVVVNLSGGPNPIFAFNSLLDGLPLPTGLKCVGVFNSNLDPVTCP